MRRLGNILLEAASWIPTLALVSSAILFFDWIDYEAKGKSAFWGLNPRCVVRYGDCVELDRANLPWDTAFAVWLDGWIWLAFPLLCFGAAVALWSFDRLRR